MVRIPALPALPKFFRFVTASPAVKLALYKGGKFSHYITGTQPVLNFRSLALVPASVQLVSFSFEELSSDKQRVTVQGDLMVLVNPETALQRFDLTVDIETLEYNNDEALELLYGDVKSALQRVLRALIAGKTLTENLLGASALEEAASEGLKAKAAELIALGFTVQQLAVGKVSAADSNLSKALEAKTREELLTEQDNAVAVRRDRQAENARRIQKYELETAQEVEAQRAQLIEKRNANVIAEATADAEAAAKRLATFEGKDPAVIFALAIQKLAESGTHVENLNLGDAMLNLLAKKAA
jgi:hypothetical protein